MNDLLERAEALIVASSGVPEWRPLFVLGLQSAAIFVALAVVIVVMIWKFGR